MKRIVIGLVLGLMALNVSAQKEEKTPIKIGFNGFVKADMIYDSRKTMEAREGFFSFCPLDENLNDAGEDMNAISGLNHYGMASRVRATVSGPKSFGADVKAIMEADFTGHSNSDENGLRLRLAYIHFKWATTEVIFGQDWHPFVVLEAMPAVVSLNTGAPFHAFSRQPQLKLKQHFGNTYLLAAINTQRDFLSSGPNGKSFNYMRYNVFPDLNLQFHYKGKKIGAGVAAEYKSLRPQVLDSVNNIVDETINSKAGLAYVKYQGKKFRAVVQAVYGENLYDYLMFAGYAVSAADPLSQNQQYTAISQSSLWADLNYTMDHFKVGVFMGYLKNNGAGEDVDLTQIYSRGVNIDNMMRVSPRISVQSGNVELLLEYEYTQAEYGTINVDATVDGERKVANNRVTFTAMYKF
jgi:hypothetical protein